MVGGSAKSDFISKEALIKHLRRGDSKTVKIIGYHIWTAPKLSCNDICSYLQNAKMRSFEILNHDQSGPTFSRAPIRNLN